VAASADGKRAPRSGLQLHDPDVIAKRIAQSDVDPIRLLRNLRQMRDAQRFGEAVASRTRSILRLHCSTDSDIHLTTSGSPMTVAA
jgi:hypothetical protein